MMTKQEVSQEMKDAEGNPHVRGQIRKRRRAHAQAMDDERRRAGDGRIVNPQHFAVALEYRPQTMPAPVVVAKGMNEVALRIKEDRALEQYPDRRKSAARAGAVSSHGSRRGDSGQAVYGGRGNPGVLVSHAGEPAQSVQAREPPRIPPRERGTRMASGAAVRPKEG